MNPNHRISMSRLLLDSALLMVLTVWIGSGAARAADSLLKAPDDAPWYELSNLRIEDDRFGHTNLVFDYRRTREGKGRVELAARSAEGPMRITFAPDVSQPTGVVRLTKMFPSFGGGAYNFEFYLVVPATWAGESHGSCLVSNTVRIGNPGPSPQALTWSNEQRVAYEKHQRADEPPGTPPEGMEAIKNQRDLIPGMSVMAGRYGDWVNAELIALAPNDKVSVRYEGDKRATTIGFRGWLAAEPEVLARARRDPGGFEPSMRVLPGGQHALPSDAIAIERGLDLPRGAPLLLYWGGDWKTVYVKEDMGRRVSIIFEDRPGNHDWEYDRDDLAIRQSTVQELSDAGAVRGFAKNVLDESMFADDEIPIDTEDAWGSSLNDKYHVIDRSYPIETRIPKGAVVAPQDIKLPRGAEVAYCWARKWQAATLIEDRGPVLIIKEDDNVTNFVYRLLRNQVIVRTKTLRQLERENKADAEDLRATLRTWTDSTGKHKIEAKFVSIDEGEVTLITGVGRKITLPLERLCEEDQKLLDGIDDDSDNPFK